MKKMLVKGVYATLLIAIMASFYCVSSKAQNLTTTDTIKSITAIINGFTFVENVHARGTDTARGSVYYGYDPKISTPIPINNSSDSVIGNGIFNKTFTGFIPGQQIWIKIMGTDNVGPYQSNIMTVTPLATPIKPSISWSGIPINNNGSIIYSVNVNTNVTATLQVYTINIDSNNDTSYSKIGAIKTIAPGNYGLIDSVYGPASFAYWYMVKIFNPAGFDSTGIVKVPGYVAPKPSWGHIDSARQSGSNQYTVYATINPYSDTKVRFIFKNKSTGKTDTTAANFITGNNDGLSVVPTGAIENNLIAGPNYEITGILQSKLGNSITDNTYTFHIDIVPTLQFPSFNVNTSGLYVTVNESHIIPSPSIISISIEICDGADSTGPALWSKTFPNQSGNNALSWVFKVNPGKSYYARVKGIYNGKPFTKVAPFSIPSGNESIVIGSGVASENSATFPITVNIPYSDTIQNPIFTLTDLNDFSVRQETVAFLTGMNKSTSKKYLNLTQGHKYSLAIDYNYYGNALHNENTARINPANVTLTKSLPVINQRQATINLSGSAPFVNDTALLYTTLTNSLTGETKDSVLTLTHKSQNFSLVYPGLSMGIKYYFQAKALYQDTSKILNDSVIIKTEVATLKNLKVTTVLHRKANVSVDCFAPKGDVVPVIITFTDLTTLLIANKPIDTTVTGLETIYVSCDNIYPGHDYEAKVEALYKVNDVIVNDTTVTKNFMISNDTLTVSVVPKLPIGRTGFPSFKVTVPNGDVLANCTVTVQDSATGQVIGNPYVHTNLSGTMTIVDTCKGLNPGTYIYQFDGTYFGNPVSRSGYFTINTGKIKFTNFILKSVSQENASIVFKVQIPNAETGIINLVLKDSIGNSVSNEDIQVSNTAVITRNFNNLIPDSKYKISVSGDYFTVPSGLDTSFVTPFYKVTYDVSSQALNGTVTVAGSYSAIKSVDLQVAYFLAIDTDFISPIEPRFITGQVGNINEVFENIPDGGYRVLISGTCNGYPVNSWKSLPFHFGSIKPITINSISSAVVNSSTININSKVTVPNSQSGTCYFMVATDSFFISTVIDSISVVGMQNISTSFTKMDTGTYWVKLRTKTYDVIVDSKVMIVTVLPIQLTLIQDVVGTSKDIAVVNFKFSAPDTLDVITGYYTTDDSNFLFPLATQTIRGNMGVESIRFDSIPNGSYIMRIIGLYNGYYTNSKTYPFIISVTAIQIISAEEDVRIYPNPATDFIVLSTTGEYAIINMAGQMVKMGLNNSEQINVSELKNGTYILKMNNGKFAKFIKR